MAISFCPREKWQLIYFPRPSVAGEAFCKIVRNSDAKELKGQETGCVAVQLSEGKPQTSEAFCKIVKKPDKKEATAL